MLPSPVSASTSALNAGGNASVMLPSRVEMSQASLICVSAPTLTRMDPRPGPVPASSRKAYEAAEQALLAEAAAIGSKSGSKGGSKG